MKNSKVSVIMPVYNGEKYITEAIESVPSQTYRNFEVIIINNGSTDNSFARIEQYLNLPGVEYME